MDAKIKQLWDEKNYDGALELLTQASYGAVPDIQALELRSKLPELMSLVIQSQEKLDAGEKDDAIEFLRAAQDIQVIIPEWVYQPLSFLEERLGVTPLETDAHYESQQKKQQEKPISDGRTDEQKSVDDGRGEGPQGDTTGILGDGKDRMETLHNRLFEDDLLPDQEIEAIDQLINMGERFDLKGQDLSVRKQIVLAEVASIERRYLASINIFRNVRENLQSSKDSRNINELNRRIDVKFAEAFDKYKKDELVHIDGLRNEGQLDNALKTCEALLEMNFDDQVRNIREEIVRQKGQDDKVNSIIGTGSLSSWAEEELSKLEPGIAKEKLAAWIADKKQQVLTLQSEAELAASKGDFKKADELYARLVAIDPNNNEIAVRQFDIHNDIGRHAQLTENIEKARQALARNDFRNADPFYKAAVELDKSGLHVEELQQLKEKWEEVRSKWDASVSRGFDSEKDPKRWPEEILSEIILIKGGPKENETDIVSAINNLVKGYIPAHTSKLASDLNLIASRDILEIEESIVALEEIDEHWKNHLDEPDFNVSEHYSFLKKQVERIWAQLAFYKEILPLVASIKKGKQDASAAIARGNYIEAQKILKACLDKMPEEGDDAYTYLKQQIQSLETQQEEIRSRYQRSTDLLRKRAFSEIVGGNYDIALTLLAQIPVEQQTAEDDTLALQAEHGQKLLAYFISAEDAFKRGKWKKANSDLEKISHYIVNLKDGDEDIPPAPEWDLAKKYLQCVKPFEEIDQKLKAISKRSIKNENDISRLDNEIAQLLKDAELLEQNIHYSDYLQNLKDSWDSRKDSYLEVLNLLKTQDFNRVLKILSSFKNSHDKGELEYWVDKYKDVKKVIKTANKELAILQETVSSVQREQSTRTSNVNVRTALMKILKRCDKQLKSIRAAQKSGIMNSDLEDLQKEFENICTQLKSAEKFLSASENHENEQQYDIAYQKCSDASRLILELGFPELSELIKQERNRLFGPAQVHNKFSSGLKAAENHLDKNQLDKALDQIDANSKLMDDYALPQVFQDALSAFVKKHLKIKAEEYIENELGQGHRTLAFDFFNRIKNNEHIFPMFSDTDDRLDLWKITHEVEDLLEGNKLPEAKVKLDGLQNLHAKNPGAKKKMERLTHEYCARELILEADVLLAKGDSCNENELERFKGIISDAKNIPKNLGHVTELLSERLKLLEFQQNLLMAQSFEKLGKFSEAVTQYRNAEIIDETIDMPRRKRIDLEKLISLLSEGRANLENGKLLNATNVLLAMTDIRTRLELFGSKEKPGWSDAVDFRNSLLDSLNTAGKKYEAQEEYDLAVEYYELLQKIDDEDQSCQELQDKLRFNSGKLKEKSMEILQDPNAKRQDLIELEKELEKVIPAAHSKWLKQEREAWVAQMLTKIQDFRDRVEKTEICQSNARQVLDEFLNSEEINDYLNIGSTLEPIANDPILTRRKSILDLKADAARFLSAHQRISKALEEYISAGKTDIETQKPLINVIKASDPKENLAITRRALKLLA